MYVITTIQYHIDPLCYKQHVLIYLTSTCHLLAIYHAAVQAQACAPHFLSGQGQAKSCVARPASSGASHRPSCTSSLTVSQGYIELRRT